MGFHTFPKGICLKVNVIARLEYEIYIYIYIYIYIMSCRQHEYPWPSLATSSYRSSPLAGLQDYCMYVRAGRPAFARPYVEVHWSTSLLSSSLLLQQCPACLVRLTWIVFVMEGRWPYSWCFVGCYLQDLFMIDIYIYIYISRNSDFLIQTDI